MEKRISWIDITRAFFIFAIVMGHLYNYGYLRYWVFSFHVPAFFFISGFCFRYKEGFARMLRGKIRKIAVPYFVFSLFSILLFWGTSKLMPAIRQLLECGLFANLLTMWYGSSKPNTMKYNQPLWFLTCFFVVSIAAWCIERWNRNRRLGRMVAIVFCVAGGGILSRLEWLALPWHMETAVSMLVWYLCGIQVRSCWSRIEANVLEKNSRAFQIIGAFLCIALGSWVATWNSRIVGVRNDHYGNFVFYYLGAFLGICGFLFLGYGIRTNKVLEYIRKNTLAILVLHKFPIIFFQEFLPFTAKALAEPNSFGGLFCGIAVGLLTTAMALLGGVVIKRVWPQALGESRKARQLVQKVGRSV